MLPLPVYNPSKSMNQHRGSTGAGETLERSCFQLLFPRQTQHSPQGWSFAFPSPEPQCPRLKRSSRPREQAAHVRQRSGSSSAPGAPLLPGGTRLGALTAGAGEAKPGPQGQDPALRWHALTPQLLPGIASAHAQRLPPRPRPLRVSGPLAVPQPRAGSPPARHPSPGSQLSFTPPSHSAKGPGPPRAPTPGLCPASTSPSPAGERAPSGGRRCCWCQPEAGLLQGALSKPVRLPPALPCLRALRSPFHAGHRQPRSPRAAHAAYPRGCCSPYAALHPQQP